MRAIKSVGPPEARPTTSFKVVLSILGKMNSDSSRCKK